MRLLRRRPVFRYLALLALATQVVSSFAHVHAGPVGGHRTQARTFFAAASDTCLPGSSDHRDCLICLATALLGSSVVPEAAHVTGAAFRLECVLFDRADEASHTIGTASFRARAPPSQGLA